jgi:hypothetical protein
LSWKSTGNPFWPEKDRKVLEKSWNFHTCPGKQDLSMLYLVQTVVFSIHSKLI